MTDTSDNIQTRIASMGTENERQRRLELWAHIVDAYEEAGSDGVSIEIKTIFDEKTRRIRQIIDEIRRLF